MLPVPDFPSEQSINCSPILSSRSGLISPRPKTSILQRKAWPNWSPTESNEPSLWRQALVPAWYPLPSTPQRLLSVSMANPSSKPCWMLSFAPVLRKSTLSEDIWGSSSTSSKKSTLILSLWTIQTIRKATTFLRL